MLLNFGVILVGFAALIWSADRFVEGAANIARSFGMPPLLIGMTIVSIGTSAPEILVSLMAAATGSGALAVGNAFGSNIANIGLVLGATMVIAPIAVGRITVFKDLPMLLITIGICWVLLWDRELSFIDALLLLGGLILFFWRMYSHTKHPDSHDETPDIPIMPAKKAWLTFFAGLIVLIIASRALVWAAVNVAQAFGVSELVIGLTIVAIGTSLPELAASVFSAMKGHADIAIGAVVGSNMFNLLVVLSLPGLFVDLPLSDEAIDRDLLTVSITTAILALMTWLNWDKSRVEARLGRWGGALFLTIYALYYVWLFMKPATEV